MSEADVMYILELRSVVRWSSDPEAFGLLRGMRDARWAVAEAPGGSLAGMVGAVPLGEIGLLCHLAVHEEHRGLGLGMALTRWAVAYLRSRGANLVRLYSTRRAEKLYRTVGFRPSVMRSVYRLHKPPGEMRAPESSAGCRVQTLLAGDLPELYGVDWWSYGADRSHLILATLRMHPGRGLIARDSAGRIKGYLIRSSSRGATLLGPFMAANITTARLLLGRALATNGGAPVELTVPGPEASPAHVLLRESGFERRADRRRMELGALARRPRPGLEQYATTAYLAT